MERDEQGTRYTSNFPNASHPIPRAEGLQRGKALRLQQVGRHQPNVQWLQPPGGELLLTTLLWIRIIFFKG